MVYTSDSIRLPLFTTVHHVCTKRGSQRASDSTSWVCIAVSLSNSDSIVYGRTHISENGFVELDPTLSAGSSVLHCAITYAHEFVIMCMWIRLNLNLIHPSAAFVLHCVIMYAQWVCHYVHAAIPCTSLVRICIEHHGSLHNTAAGKYLPCSAPYTLRDILKTHAHCHLLACSFSCDWLQQPPHTNSVLFAWQQPATHVLLMQHVGLMQGSHTHAESISLCVPVPPEPRCFALHLLPFQTLHWTNRSCMHESQEWLATSAHFAATIRFSCHS